MCDVEVRAARQVAVDQKDLRLGVAAEAVRVEKALQRSDQGMAEAGGLLAPMQPRGGEPPILRLSGGGDEPVEEIDLPGGDHGKG